MATEVIDRSKAKRYFKGSVGPVILIFAGIVLFMVTFGLLLIGGIIWFLVDRYTGNKEAEMEIDKLIETETQMLKERGMGKLNIVDEQISLIPPICLNGPSYNPESINASSTVAFFQKFFGFLTKNDDPIWRSKVGADGKWRYSLIEVNIFMFDERQMYLYYACLDLTTGFIFQEGTYEYFYSDVVAISTDQIQLKILNPRKKKYERRLFEYITVYTSGCSRKASISTEINASLIDQQFTAMRNLIREKKEFAVR